MTFGGQTAKFLEPIQGPIKKRSFATFDIESKDGPTQRAGFTRPFLVGFYDGTTFTSFRDTTKLEWKKRRCRHCRKKMTGFDPQRLCVSEERQRHGKPCEPEGWEEAHLESRRGCLDKVLRHFLCPKYNGWILYAHNGGSFDHLFVLPWLTSHRHLGFDFTVVPVASTIQTIEITRVLKNGTKLSWTLRDSMRLLPMSLDKAAKAFGLGGKVEMDLHAHEDDPRWARYLKVDCVKLYKTMLRVHELMEDKLGGEVGMTAPASAMKLFRRRFLKRPIHRHAHFKDCSGHGACDDCCHAWIRRAYYGGRTEIFEMFGEGLKYFDLNSSYVAAMRQPQPVYERYEAYGEIDWRIRKTHVGFAEVSVRIPHDCPVPPLPHRADKTNKLIFPVGEFRGVWDVDELALVPRVGGEVFDVGRVVWIKQAAIFEEMVDTLWAFRDKTRADYDEGLSELAKLLGNSTYGKFAMDPNKEEIVFSKGHKRAEPKEGKEGESNQNSSKQQWECFLCGTVSPRILCESCMGSKAAGVKTGPSSVWYKARRVSAAYIIPQIAAHITTIGRIALWEYLMMAYKKTLVKVTSDDGRSVEMRSVQTNRAKKEERRWMGRGFSTSTEAGRVMYGDTDSCLTNVELPSSKALGKLKDEYPGERLKGRFLQPKVYILEKEKPFVKEHLDGCNDKKCQGCATTKVAMKGLPKRERTMLNLENLMTCATCRKPIDVTNMERLCEQPAKPGDTCQGGTVAFTRLQKVRSMARLGFNAPPKMDDVKKRIVEPYDKRRVLPDGRTVAIVLSLPDERLAEREMAQAAE